MSTDKYLIVVLGPTAVGKTAACITLAQRLEAAIVSADARQCYEKMDIGVAKPTAEERAAATHHLIDFVPLTTHYSAGAYARDALALLPRLWAKRPYVILTGGSGLYIQAVCEGIAPMPTVPPETYDALHTLYQTKGLAPLLQALEAKDPVYYAEVDRKNPMRILRALSVCEATQRPFSFFRGRKGRTRDFKVVKIGLERPRPELYARIDKRVDVMMAQGLWEEAMALYPYRDLSALATIGYREIFGCLEGKHSQGYAVDLIKQHTRHYAKRQGTWFRRERAVRWFHPEDLGAIEAYVRQEVARH